jgi:predicted secreted protein
MTDTIEISESENGKLVETSLHQTVRIALSEIPTAGYRWQLRPTASTTLSMIRDYVTPPNGKQAGGATMHCWDFQAAGVGTTHLEFQYSRSWESEAEPSRQFSVSVRVS